jgi:hypothetical protein
MSGFCGATIAPNAGTKGKYIIRGGGHGDYQGPETYGFDLDTRTWSLLGHVNANAITSYTGLNGAGAGWWASDGDHVNGTPAVPHSYSQVLRCHPTRNSLFAFMAQTNSGTAATSPHVGEFPLDGPNQYVWQSLATAGFDIPSEGCSLYDSLRDEFVIHGASGAAHTAVYKVATNAWSSHSQADEQWIQDSYSVWAHDTTNDFIMAVRPNGTIYGQDAADRTAAAVTLTTSGKPTITSSGSFEYLPALNGFIWHPDGADVYLVTKGSGSWASATWTWTNMLAGTNSITPETNESAGVYSKGQVITWGNRSIFLVFKRTGLTGAGAGYAMRLS